MKPSERLVPTRKLLEKVCAFTPVGTQDVPRFVTRVDLASQRAEDRAGGGSLPRETRGGSSHPSVEDERREAERVKRQAARDVERLDELAKRIARDAQEIAQITDRQAEIVHESKLPVDVLPGCRSCGRREEHNGHTIGPHWAGITDKAPASGLCRQCNNFKIATGGLPPFMWCHLRHTKGGEHANRWLGKEFPHLLESVQRKAKAKDEPLPPCGTVWTHLGADHVCIRAQEHEMPHRDGNAVGWDEHGNPVERVA